ncbi:hypothetical protein MMC11_007808 [Xylographa trunciseda]|nr:hypothetical protein [Xylographa trunciseda]
MSVVNLLGNVLTANYPYRYLVESEMMNEAIERGSKFTGVVGRVLPLRTVEALGAETITEAHGDVSTTFICRANGQYEIDKHDDIGSINRNEPDGAEHLTQNGNPVTDHEGDRRVVGDPETTTLDVPNCTRFLRHTDRLTDPPEGFTGTLLLTAPPRKAMSVSALRMLWVRSLLIYFTISAIPIAIIGGLTRFGTGSDGTRKTEGFFTAWIVGGIFLGPVITYNSFKTWVTGARQALVLTTLLGAEIMIPILFLVPPIAGWVYVGMQLREWGDCVYFG